jgi:nitrogen fixation protein NifX
MAIIAHKLELAADSFGEGPARSKRADPRENEARLGPKVRVAVASQDGKALNAHFGYARKLMVYDVTLRGHRLVKVFTFVGGSEAEDDKITPKVTALAGCHIVCVLAIGPPAAAAIIRANIHPIRVGEAEPIQAAIARVRTMMTVDPPGWLRRILLQNSRSPRDKTNPERDEP